MESPPLLFFFFKRRLSVYSQLSSYIDQIGLKLRAPSASPVYWEICVLINLHPIN